MKNLSEVLRDTGLNYYTLFKYSSLGLIPRPQRVWLGRGKGSASLYPDDIVDIIKRIQEEKKSGLTIRQIAENRAVERATDVFADIMSRYPEYRFTHGDIKESDEKPDGKLLVTVRLEGEKRR